MIRLYPSRAFLVRGLLSLGIVVSISGLLRSDDPVGSGILLQDCLVRFAKEVRVPALESGAVAEVNVVENQWIDKGDTIARLQDRTLKIRRQASQRRLDFANQQATSNNEIEYAGNAWERAKEDLRSHRTIYQASPGAVPRTLLRKLELAVKAGELEVQQAKDRQLAARVEAADREAELLLIDNQLENHRIPSPLGGVILEVLHSEGEWIQQGEPIATIGRMDRLHVRALLRADQLSATDCLHLPVSVHWVEPSSGEERSLRGEVVSVDPQVLSGGQFLRLHAEIENRPVKNFSDWLLRPGTEVRMKVYPRGATARRESESVRR